MKKMYRLLSVFLVCALLIPVSSICVSAADEEETYLSDTTEVTLYLSEEEAQHLDEELAYTSKTVYANSDGVAPCSTYTIDLSSYETKSYSFGYVASGKTMYICCKGGAITGTLYYGSKSTSMTNVAFTSTSRVIDRTCLSTGNYYKFSMKNETGSYITLSLTVYTY